MFFSFPLNYQPFYQECAQVQKTVADYKGIKSNPQSIANKPVPTDFTVILFVRGIKNYKCQRGNEQNIFNEAIKELNTIKARIPQQTYRTIIGQMRAGDLGGATVGIERLKKKLAREDAANENRSRK